MTTTISIPTAEYDLAKAYAQKQNLSIDELFVTLIRMLPQDKDDDLWNSHNDPLSPYTIEELEARIDEGESQFERGEYVTHEQMMKDLKEQFSWLR